MKLKGRRTSQKKLCAAGDWVVDRIREVLNQYGLQAEQAELRHTSLFPNCDIMDPAGNGQGKWNGFGSARFVTRLNTSQCDLNLAGRIRHQAFCARAMMLDPGFRVGSWHCRRTNPPTIRKVILNN